MHQQNGCAGIMIERGSYGQALIFNQVKDLLAGGQSDPPRCRAALCNALDSRGAR